MAICFFVQANFKGRKSLEKTEQTNQAAIKHM
jgi:hypothetical protein